MKKLLAAWLVCCLLVPCFALGETEDTFISGEWEYAVRADGRACIVKYLADERVVLVPARLDGHPVAEIGGHAFEEWWSIESVIIQDGVERIGEYAFRLCRNLAAIEIPDSVQEMGPAVFYGCDKLASVKLPKGLTEIPEMAFLECTSLISLTVPASVQAVADTALYACNAMTVIVEPGSWMADYCGRNMIPYLCLDSQD